MAAASNPTKRSSNDPCQKMIEKITDAREDIKLIYEESKKILLLELENLRQKADDISEMPKVDNNELEQIVNRIEQIKETAKSCVPLPQDSSAKTSDASDDKRRNITIEGDEWPKLEMDLEKILENTAVKYKYEDYKKVLDGILKNCLLCLAIFPQNATIQKRTLIYWWIGEGFVNATATETAEDVGEIYFKKLLEGSWIYAVNNRSSPNVREFKMDPWVRWLVIYLAREEEFFYLDKKGMPYSSPSKYRYCLLKNKNKPTSLEPKESSQGEGNPSNQEGSTGSSFNEKNLSNQEGSIKSSPGKRNNLNQEGSTKGHSKILSVFNVNAERLCAQKLFLTFKEMKSLLVLHLGRWQTPAKRHLDCVNNCQTPAKRQYDCHIEFEDEESELLECLHKLGLPLRLRYLSFAGISRITELPTAVKKLSHLKILDLRSCQNLEHLGEEIIFLRSLTHLDVSECYMLDHMPKGLGTLSQLEVLKGFIFGSLRSKDPCRLAELAKLKKLRKLSISIGGEAQIQPKEMTKLKDINGLRSIAITWGKLSQTLPADDKKTLEENWIEWMSFPSGLEKLDLRCFPEKTVWLDPNLKKLKKLFIRGGKVEDINIKAEAETDRKMDVEMIRLKFLEKLAGKWSELKKCSELKKWFPVLNYLEIHECPSLEYISELHYNIWMEEPTEENNCDTAVTSAPTTDAPADPPAQPSPSECPVVPPPTGNVPTSNDTSVGEADGATTTSTSHDTNTSRTPKSSSLDPTEVSAPPDIPDRAPIPNDNSSPTTNITSSSAAPAAPSGLGHSTSTTPTSSSLAAVAPSVILDNPSCISTDTSTPTSAIPNEDTTLTTNPGTSSSQTPAHPTSSTTDAAHDPPTPTDPSNSLSSLDKGHVVADSTSINPNSSPVAQNNASISATMSDHDHDTSAAATDTVVTNPTGTSKTPKSSSIDTTEVVGPPDISDCAPIPTDNSSPTTDNTSSSPAPAAPSGRAHSSTTKASSLHTSAAVVPSAIPDNLSCISANTSTPSPANQSEDTTLTTIPNASTSQTPPHPTSPTTDAANDTPTPTDPSYSLSSLDKGHAVADSSSFTPTSSSPVEQNNATISATLSARDQDTSAASNYTVVSHPPREPVLASTHIDSLRTASSATQEAPDVYPSLPTMTDSTVSATVSKTASAPYTAKDSSLASLSATATGTAASPA